MPVIADAPFAYRLGPTAMDAASLASCCLNVRLRRGSGVTFDEDTRMGLNDCFVLFQVEI